ncbi:MarR family winged helix-turn-helix transcriptional regulator [Lacipirellula sp.]|uniref:MarR family winged helix-turn-helix transcriptional regulator n=1 Tax=Lacipirellula sp. TaxID=2691419 RepID=UPI003D119EF6
MSGGSLQADLKKREPFASGEQEAMIGLWRVSDWSMNRFGALFREFELTSSQYNVLRILRGAGEPLPVQEISSRMIQPVPAMTGLVDRLEKALLVERRRIAEDRRVIHVAITKKGEAVLKKLDKPVVELHERIMASLTKSEVKQLAGLMEKLAGKIRGCE